MSGVKERGARKFLVEGVPVPGDGKLDPMTQKAWGSAHAVNVLNYAIENRQNRFDEIMNLPEGSTYESEEMMEILRDLGLFHEALGLHLRVQAVRHKDTGTVTVGHSYYVKEVPSAADGRGEEVPQEGPRGLQG